jgi:hypothetical protein
MGSHMKRPIRIQGINGPLKGRTWEAADLLRGVGTVAVDYDDDPYGVRYWVARWADR